MRGWLSRLLPVALAGVLPVLFIPIWTDSYILPRVLLVLAGGVAGLVGFRRGVLGTLFWPAVAVCAAAVVAGVLSVNPSRSLLGLFTRYESWPVRVAYVGLFCLGAWSGAGGGAGAGASRGVEGGDGWRRVADWFCLGVAVAALEAGVQFWIGAPPRPDGNLGQPGLLGVLCAMALVLAVARALRSWWWLPVPAVLGAGLLLSSARSAWAAAAAGLLAWAWFALPRRRGWVAVGLVVVVVAGLGLFFFTPLHDLNRDSGLGRLSVWPDGLRLIAGRPLFGSGEDTVGLVEPEAFFDRLHSVPLDLLATQGLAGLAACAWFWGVFWWRGRSAPAPLLGALAAYPAWALVNFDWAPATGPFWLLAGVAWVEATRPRPRRTPRSRSRDGSTRSRPARSTAA